MALSDIDRNLLERCLARKPRAWEDFVDRFMGLVVHVANHTSAARSISLSAEDREDLCAQVFLEIVKDDFTALRRFRRQSSLATYLTVIARRVIVRRLAPERTAPATNGKPPSTEKLPADQPAAEESPTKRITDREEVERLLAELEGNEKDVVRMYHLEGKSYRQISSDVGVAENSIGPMLSRAREKMRRAVEQREGEKAAAE